MELILSQVRRDFPALPSLLMIMTERGGLLKADQALREVFLGCHVQILKRNRREFH